MVICSFLPTQAVGLGYGVSGLRPDLRPPASGLQPAVSGFEPATANRSASRLEDEKEMSIASQDFAFPDLRAGWPGFSSYRKFLMGSCLTQLGL